MLSSQEEQAERRRVLANDARVREQSGTFFSHTHMDEGGRFAQVSNAQIVGADPIPAASAAHQIQLPDEPPLGLDNPALENSTVACPFEIKLAARYKLQRPPQYLQVSCQISTLLGRHLANRSVDFRSQRYAPTNRPRRSSQEHET